MSIESKSSDVLIVGGGIHGCALARELALAGRDVVVLERSVPGAEASSAAGGILGPHLEADHGQEFFQLARYSLGLYPEWVGELEQETGEDIRLNPCGGMQLCFEEATVERRKDEAHSMAARGLPAQWLDPQECRDLEPGLGDALGGIYFPDEYQIEPRRLMAGLSMAARRAGARFKRDRVLRIDEARLALHCESGIRSADVIVLAAGAWTAGLPGSGLRKDAITPARGQMLQLRCPERPASSILFSERGYVVPRLDGRVLVGSTLEFVGFEKAVTEDGVRNMLQTGTQMLPVLAQAELEDSWSGFRPWTPDHLPLVGPSQREGLWFSAGHYRNGILLAPASAKLLAQAICGRPESHPLGAFAPARFAV